MVSFIYPKSPGTALQHPSEVLKVGQEIKVKVISIDREKKRIGLSIRQLQDDPWSNQAAVFTVGQLVQGKITRLTKFGAFAQLEGDIEGLIHISELSEKRIEHPKEVLKEGETVTLRVIKIDPANHRIGLSLRRVDSMAYAEMDWQVLEEGDTLSDEQIITSTEEKVTPPTDEQVTPPTDEQDTTPADEQDDTTAA